MRSPRTKTVVIGTALAAVVGLGAVTPAMTTSAPTALVSHSVRMAPKPFAGKTPAAVLKLSTAAMNKASSVHITGTAPMPSGGGTQTVDIVITKTASKGTFRTTTQGTSIVIRIGSTMYLGGDKKFWTSTAGATSAALAGKYIKITDNDSSTKDLRASTMMSYWSTDLAALVVSKQVPGKVLHGLPTVGLVDTTATGGTVYVATKGQPYPMQAVSSDRKNVTNYFDWNKKVTVAPPAANTVVKI